jgi:hypothetical protein
VAPFMLSCLSDAQCSEGESDGILFALLSLRCAMLGGRGRRHPLCSPDMECLWEEKLSQMCDVQGCAVRGMIDSQKRFYIFKLIF